MATQRVKPNPTHFRTIVQTDVPARTQRQA